MQEHNKSRNVKYGPWFTTASLYASETWWASPVRATRTIRNGSESTELKSRSSADPIPFSAPVCYTTNR